MITPTNQMATTSAAKRAAPQKAAARQRNPEPVKDQFSSSTPTGRELADPSNYSAVMKAQSELSVRAFDATSLQVPGLSVGLEIAGGCLHGIEGATLVLLGKEAFIMTEDGSVLPQPPTAKPERGYVSLPDGNVQVWTEIDKLVVHRFASAPTSHMTVEYTRFNNNFTFNNMKFVVDHETKAEFKDGRVNLEVRDHEEGARYELTDREIYNLKDYKARKANSSTKARRHLAEGAVQVEKTMEKLLPPN
ncbi:MAG: hypothetical protein WC314_17650 [Vulcanimicrobiota bacterium]